MRPTCCWASRIENSLSFISCSYQLTSNFYGIVEQLKINSGELRKKFIIKDMKKYSSCRFVNI